MAYQTSVQDSTALMEGSAKVSVAAYSGSPSWLNLGVVENLAAKEVMTITDRKADNGAIDTHVSDQHAEISFDQLEALKESARAILRGATFDTTTPVAATPVSGRNQTIISGAWVYDGFIEFDRQNSSGAKITPTSVTGGTDGALVLGTDFYIIKDVATGKWGIAVKDSATVTTLAQNLVIVYDYTPAASKLVETGGKASGLPRFMLKLENVDASGLYTTLTFFSVRIDGGIEFAYKRDNDGDNLIRRPIRLRADLDTTKAVGKQLFSQYQEKGIA